MLARLKQAAEGTRLKPRFIVPEQLHSTLKFLGHVEPEKIQELKAIGARNAARFGPFELAWKGLIAFGGMRRARALVAGIEHDGSALADFATAIESDVEPLGIERETRTFRAHVTLARLKRPGKVGRWLEAAPLEPLPLIFPELRLYQSVQTSEGGVYSVLESWPLGAAAQA